MKQGKSTQRKNGKGSKTGYQVSVSNRPGNVETHYPKREKPYRITIRKGLSAPDEVRVALRYTAQVAITNTVGVPNSYLFTGNGPFDPDNTGIGSQPNGYDQWSTMYTKQRTLGSRIIVRPVSASTSLNPVDVVVAPVTSAVTVSTSIENLKCNKFAVENLLSSAFRTVVSAAMSSECIFGVPPAAIDIEQNYQSLISANPTSLWLWQISCTPVDGVSTITTQFFVDLEFDVIFFNRKDNGLS